MYTLVAVALFAGAAWAQIPGLPQCAQGCVTNYGGCNQVDVKCICENRPLLETLSCCVAQNCDEAGTEEVVRFANALCGSYGVTSLPTAATCAATATATATATAAPTSASGTESDTATVTSMPATSSSSSSSSSAAGNTAASTVASSTGTSAAAAAIAAPTHLAQKVLGLGLGLGAAGLLGVW